MTEHMKYTIATPKRETTANEPHQARNAQKARVATNRGPAEATRAAPWDGTATTNERARDAISARIEPPEANHCPRSSRRT
eukprot:CAMPEP_0118993888 /NCGR_PEP_ID=MMETSP1173-20130426/55868_1 /TAXON_ID=1034831 /ORGANISM="Rhizochromulina marina cf, Strain CCMP1243" /LENGTH=80 /DNA_ID=CAMNT_0006945145 /DNA_START=253 /DNA_END=492 /DNA_ORIENTATION=+